MMLETIILGAGPAGTGSLVWAARHGVLGDWLDAGVALVERRQLITGTTGHYALNADTYGGTFLECLTGPDCDPELVKLRADPVTLELELWRDRLPPLELVGRFIARLGVVLRTLVAQHPRSLFLTGTTARSLQLESDGTVHACIEQDGQLCYVRAATAVMALGGVQNTAWDTVEVVPGLALDRWQQKIMTSDFLLARGGIHQAQRLLAQAKHSPQVVILGGAHSAFSTAWRLLHHLPRVPFGEASIRILHRDKLKIFYLTRQAAIDEGYQFTEDDVCPATGRVFRLAGLRGDGGYICRRMQGLRGLEREDRAVAHRIDTMQFRELEAMLDAANLIVAATGYRLRTLPLLAANGEPIPLASIGPAVDHRSRLLTEDGAALDNVFGVGLGSDFKPWGSMAGEASFTGQQNSLWLYQNGLGQSIHDSVRRYAAKLQSAADIGSDGKGLDTRATEPA
jgi:hypothetical protein